MAMLALRKLLNKPKLEDGSLLSLFYYCDIAVNHQMHELNDLMRSSPDNLDRRATLIRQLKEAQHNLMNVIMSIADQAIPDKRACHGFRAKYPDDVILDQINGPIWFGAECIAAGSHIANHEIESTELRPYAIHLSKVVTKLRQTLRLQSYVNRDVYPQKIKDMLVVFDEFWADFEFRYVSLMCNVKTESQYYQQQSVVVLFCESTLRAIKMKYLSYDLLETMDPSVMFAIPRLAILCGLVVYPDGPLNPSRPTREMPHCFRGYKQLLTRIKELLGYLNQEQLGVLEQALCSSEGLGTLERNKLKAASERKRTQIGTTTDSHSGSGQQDNIASATITPVIVSASGSNSITRRPHSANIEQSGPSNSMVADQDISPPPLSSQYQRRHSYNIDSRDSMSTVFEPIPVPMAVEVGAVHEEHAVIEEVEPFPRLGVNQSIDNELPVTPLLASNPSNPNLSAHTSTPSLTPFPIFSANSSSDKVERKDPRSSKKTKRRGPAGFPSVEDLMHRLFLGISGVADQLQTNHAKDLRVILKDVFAACQSEPETIDDVVQSNKDDSQNKYSSVDELGPCTPEPQSPLISASQRFNFPTESLTIEQTPSWIPDSDSPICSICSLKFSWKKRRHHCRSCGNVVCARCSPNNIPLMKYHIKKPVRVCTNCYIRQLSQVSCNTMGISGQPLQVQ